MRLYPLALLFTACAYGSSQLGGPPSVGSASEPAGSTPAAAASSGADPTAAPCPESREPCVVKPETPPGALQEADDADADGAGPSDAEATAEASAARERVVEAARGHLGKRFRGDCSTFVRTVYSEAGVELQPPPTARTSEGLFLNMPAVERPMPGDLAFFHDTYGRVRTEARTTHVAVVESVEGAIVWLIHRGKHGIARIKLNLEARHDRGTNDYIRIRRRHDRPGLLYLAGELLSGFRALPGLAPDDP